LSTLWKNIDYLSVFKTKLVWPLDAGQRMSSGRGSLTAD